MCHEMLLYVLFWDDVHGSTFCSAVGCPVCRTCADLFISRSLQMGQENVDGSVSEGCCLNGCD